MDFTFTEEQTLLRETVSRFLADSLPFEKRQTIIDTHPGYAEGHWQSLAELGVLCLPFAEENGGLGGGAVDTMLVMDEIGRSLLTSPFLSTVLLSGAIIERLAGDDQREALLETIIAGEQKFSFAYAERGAGYNANDVSLTAIESAGAYVLNGTKIAVTHADTADQLLVLARTSGSQRDTAGLSVFLVPANADGITISGYPTQDGNRAADVRFENVSGAQLLGDLGQAWDAVDDVLDRATAGLCAEAVGIMWSVYDLTLEYMKTRKQFGSNLGSFQALQYRMVDMYMMCEMAQSMSYEAAMAFEGDDVDARRKAVSSAKSLIGVYARKVGQEGIQLHGGIGMTLEFSIGHYFKRICMIDSTFGDVEWHKTRYASYLSAG